MHRAGGRTGSPIRGRGHQSLETVPQAVHTGGAGASAPVGFWVVCVGKVGWVQNPLPVGPASVRLPGVA